MQIMSKVLSPNQVWELAVLFLTFNTSLMSHGAQLAITV